MTYAHMFHDLFGVGALDWDRLPYADFLWMRSQADEALRERAAAQAASAGPQVGGG